MTTAHPEAAGWVPLPGGVAQAEAALGRPLLQLSDSAYEAEAATCWPEDIWHAAGATPRPPLSSVWLSYGYGTDSALRVATLTEESDFRSGDEQRDMMRIGTWISATDEPTPWPEDAWRSAAAPSETPIVVDGVGHRAASFWLGPDVVVRAVCVDGVMVVVSGSLAAVNRAGLTCAS